MFLHSNFPIFNNNIGLTKEELLKYILVFSKHSVLFTKKMGVLYSFHRYDDGLLLKFSWNPLKHIPFLSSKRVENSTFILELLGDEYISLISNEIAFYSDINGTCTNEAYESFQKHVKIENRRLHITEYLKLEHDIPTPTSLPDSFFDGITDFIRKNIAFEHYLKEHNLE